MYSPLEPAPAPPTPERELSDVEWAAYLGFVDADRFRAFRHDLLAARELAAKETR